ncbi:triacylglycerol lipase [Variovorax sp. H27-G14]|uniref:esterase/lipase family protein n=1 Tax=Variovorax sp. H27-G14 TaxID=3111914 RepID=UPI0038FBFFEE
MTTRNAPLRTAATTLRAVALCCGLAAAAATAAPAHAASEEARTKYPVVLVHGLLGFDNVLGIDYFYRIPGTLAEAGAKVYVAKVSAANTSEIRGEQLLKELRTLRALSKNPSQKYNLIGHSQGSPTARYVAAVQPDLVASVTSVSGLNGGSGVADLLASPSMNLLLHVVVLPLINNWTGKTNFLSGSNANLRPDEPLGALASLTTASGAAFNAKYPQGRPAPGASCDVKSGPAVVNGVRYYSWSGASTGYSLLDPTDFLLAAIGNMVFGGQPNDGMLATCSTRLGTHLGDYRHNHLDTINHVLGNTQHGLFSYREKAVPEIFKEHAVRLKNAGL